MSNKNFVDIDNARMDDQKQVMEQIIKDDICPFCLGNVPKYHLEPIIKETQYWLLTKNHWPYTNTMFHFLILYKKHATRLVELETVAGAELFQLITWLEREYQLPGGGLVMRFGDTDYSAGTVNHIHAHVLVPDINAAGYSDKPVQVKIGKTKK